MGDLPFVDENGKEPEIDITVDQKDMERVVTPIFQKAIDITKALLKRNNLKGTDLAALILVGGPTYSPILRRMLKEQITDKLDTSVDPMTVVAKGLHYLHQLYQYQKKLKRKVGIKPNFSWILNHEATTVETEEIVNVKLLPEKTEGTIPEKVFVDIIRKPEGFSTGKKQITEKSTLIDLILEENCTNEFEIVAYDNFGNIINCQPHKFTILQVIGGVDSMQVLPTIWHCKIFSRRRKGLFFPVKGLEK